MKRTWMIVLWLLFIVISAAAFPIYNFGKHYTYAITGITLYLNIICYAELGVFEKKMIKGWTIRHAALTNLGIILSGMICRYLLEFGEISNTYNFTLKNILIHIIATFVISMFSYLL